jgi:hypothetical protein
MRQTALPIEDPMHRSLLLVVVLVLAGCAAAPETPVDNDEPPPTEGGLTVDAVLRIEEGTAGGPGITVTEALAFVGGEPVLVNGALFIDADGEVLLCEAIAESFPPQCGGARLLVEGLDPASIPDLEEANDVRWAESVQLLGRVEAAP